MKPTLNPPGTNRLKLKCDILLSSSAFKFNFHRYSLGYAAATSPELVSAKRKCLSLVIEVGWTGPFDTLVYCL